MLGILVGKKFGLDCWEINIFSRTFIFKNSLKTHIQKKKKKKKGGGGKKRPLFQLNITLCCTHLYIVQK